ncbi:MAG TPA: UvrD-helicase domain-containing protein [Candidatus Binataceae bacterium]|nr:UvrD-helicase domain-containing protein [Candidatus Binataceae bacterium]
MKTSYFPPAPLRELALDRHAVIEASAGTGKTYTMAHLAIALILAGTPVEEILAVTFTNRATAELRGRIRGLLEQLYRGGSPFAASPEDCPVALDEIAARRLRLALFNFDRAPVMTIHAFCQRVLSDFSLECDVGLNWEVGDGRLAFHRALRTAMRTELGAGRARALMENWLALPGQPGQTRVDKLENLLFAAYRLRYSNQPGPAAGAAASLEREMVEALLPAVMVRLEADKRRLGQIDYEDLLRQLWKGLEGPGGARLTEALRKRYRYALVDEFQDTDDLQWSILQRIFVNSRTGNVLMVVGDPKQAIYAFRGADVHTYLRARPLILGQDQPLKLTTNYRSTPDLVAAFNLIFDAQAKPPLLSGAIGYEPAQAALPPIVLVEEGKAAPAPVIVMQVVGERVPVSQARAALGRAIATTLRESIQAGRLQLVERNQTQPRAIRLADVFILTRTWKEADEVAGHLREAGVPYVFYKQDKLFETDEARALLDVLRAIQAPEQRSRRLRAWGSPFFGLEFDHLAALGEVPPGDPLYQRLYDWRALAQREQWAELFVSLTHRSGLVGRALFEPDSARVLSNYRQLSEILLNAVLRERLSLPELVGRLADYVCGRAVPPGENADAQRVANDSDAVQIMTVHMSKGLEAAAVFLFGGLSANRSAPEIVTYHENDERRVAIRQELPKGARPWAEEEEQEERRMLYVALTRARARLYLPLLPGKTLKQGVTGFYKPLNQRLEDIVTSVYSGRDQPHESRRLLAVERISADNGWTAEDSAQRQARMVATWIPPPQLLYASDGPPPAYYEHLRRAHGGLAMRSYSQMAGMQVKAWNNVEVEDLKLATSAPDDDSLMGGRMVGIMLHEILQRADFALVRESASAGAWLAHTAVRSLFEDAMERWGVRDPRWLEQGAEMVFHALATRLELPGARMLPPLCELRARREMEFVFPIPEPEHALLGNPHGSGWRVERGYFKGFVDLIFEHEGQVYFADWKSDHLASYEPAALAAHVNRHYSLQAMIYTVGVLRWLGVREKRTYEQRFGGLLYLFLRARSYDQGQGLFFYRPSWNEVCAYETELQRAG